MKHPRFLYFLGLVVIGGLLSGCVGPVLDPPIDLIPDPEMKDYGLVGTANFIPSNPDDDVYPLFVGARWLYRNAANYWNPQIAGSGLLESEVVAIVQGEGVECYALRTHYSNGPDQLLYLHRTKDRVGLRGSRVVAAAGAQSSYSLDPGLAFLELPLEEDASWDLLTRGGVGDAYVYHPEVAAIESGEVQTMLGTLSPIFVGAWRVHYNLPISAPRLYGGPVQFLWFAPGVGVVKHVLNSVDYELAEFRLPEEVVGLDEDDAQTLAEVPNGGLVVVQLRGATPDSADGWGWELVDIDGTAVSSLSSEFYPDTPRANTGAGTYAFQFRAAHVGTSTLTFELVHSEFGSLGDSVDYTIVVD